MNREGSTRGRQPDWHPKPKQALLQQPASLHYNIVISLSREPSYFEKKKNHRSKSFNQKCMV
jgi:hypothetical protein